MSINRLKANDDKTGIIIVKRKKTSDDPQTLDIGNFKVNRAYCDHRVSYGRLWPRSFLLS